MPQSEITQVAQAFWREARPADRFADCAARLVVYGTGDMGRPTPLRKLKAWQTPARLAWLDKVEGRVYGGRYDRVFRRYVKGPDGKKLVPENVEELRCHLGQVDFLTILRKGIKRVLGIGAMGAGKSMSGALRLLLEALENPNTTWGAVSTTQAHVESNLLKYFLALIEPRGWVDEHRKKLRQVRLVNGATIEYHGAEKNKTNGGYTFQGANWDGAVVDESSKIDGDAHNEITARGRVIASRYVVYECTLFDDFPEFVMRLAKYKLSPDEYLILWYRCEANPWIDAEAHLSNLRDGLSAGQYKRLVLLIEEPSEKLVYSHFRLGIHVRPVPKGAVDITERVTFEVLQRPFKWVLGQDFGETVTCTILLKCYELPGRKGERFWWVIDEITTRRQDATRHAKAIKQRLHDCETDDYVVLADPHFNSKDADKSDYIQFQNEGLIIHRAAFDTAIAKKQISRRHRIAMVNSLFEDAVFSTNRCAAHGCKLEGCIGHGEAHLFLAERAKHDPSARELGHALQRFETNSQGQAQPERKDERYDLTHWPDALGYGLWKFEKFRGNGQIRIVSPDNRRDFWEKDGA